MRQFEEEENDLSNLAACDLSEHDGMLGVMGIDAFALGYLK